MIISGVKLTEFEYVNDPFCAVMTFEGKGTKIRVATSDVDNAMLFSEKLQDDEAEIELKLPSKNHNYTTSSLRYCWALINRLASAMHLSKEKEYRRLIKEYTETAVASIPKEDYESGKFSSLVFGIDYYVMGESALNGKEFVHILTYKGISKMSQRELCDFTECIRKECIDLGIDTSTPSERSLYG